MPPNSVEKYQSLGDRDAAECPSFSEGVARYFTWNQLGDAEDFAEALYKDGTYGAEDGEWWYYGIKDWIKARDETR